MILKLTLFHIPLLEMAKIIVIMALDDEHSS